MTIPGTSDVREMLSAVAAPPDKPAPAQARAAVAAAGTPAASTETGASLQSFQGLVVGSRRQARIELRLANGSIADVDSRAYVLGTFRNVAPSGAARAIDAKLGGAIAEFTDRRMISSNVGEIFAIPAGRNALRADIVLFAGLGAFDAFNADVQQLVAENVIRMLARTKVEEFATVLIGGGTGQSTGAILQNLITDSSAASAMPTPSTASAPSRSARPMPAATPRSSRKCTGFPLGRCSTTSRSLSTNSRCRRWSRAGPRAGADPAYLLFRTESGTGGKLYFRSSILSSGARAALITRRSRQRSRTGRAAREAEHGGEEPPPSWRRSTPWERNWPLRSFPRPSATSCCACATGTWSWSMTSCRPRSPGNCCGSRTGRPRPNAGLTHRYMADNLPVATWAAQRRIDSALNVLLIANPTQDLAGADEEAKRMRDVAAKSAGIRLTELAARESHPQRRPDELRSGQYDVLHYAGHAHFDPVNRAQSGLRLADAPLRGAISRGFSNLPTLVFFNACESGRVRGAKAPAGPTPRERVDERGRPRRGSFTFRRRQLPRHLLARQRRRRLAVRQPASTRICSGGAKLGDALQNGRKVVRALPSRDWADYVFYGSQDFALKEGAR